MINHENVSNLSQVNNDKSVIYKPKNHYDYIVYNDDNEDESDEDGEYEETLEEGIPCEPPYDKEYYKHQNNRYACPKVILETVEQESEEGTTIKYFSQKSKANEKEDFHSVRLNNNSLAQIPVDSSLQNGKSQTIVKSSYGKNFSKYSTSPQNKDKFTKINKLNEPTEMSVRLFKDITYKLNPANKGYSNSNDQTVIKSHYNKNSSASNEPEKVVFCENINELDEKCMPKEPIGYAQIDLMNDLIQESDSEGIPTEQFNSKLDVMQNAFH